MWSVWRKNIILVIITEKVVIIQSVLVSWKEELAKMVPVNVISTYSLLKSTIRPEKLVEFAKAQGYSAVALTDENVLYGAVKFYHAAQAANLTPVLGLKVRIANFKTIVYAKGSQGYQALSRLSSTIMTQADPLSLATFLKLTANLPIAVEPATILLAYQDQDLQAILRALTKEHPIDLYAGINLELDPVQQTAIQNWAQKHDLPLLAMDPVEYLKPDDYFSTQVLRAIGNGHEIKDPHLVANRQGSHFLRSAAELMQAYQTAGLKEAALNTERLARECQLTIKFQAPVLPAFPVPTEESSQAYLQKLCQAGLRARGLTTAPYQDRLAHELAQIHKLGFDDYFLIVWDVMHFVHQQKITTGPGRGSAAGSLVAYALQITDVDPLKYHLLFERFLNPERAQMPDIDLDIPDNHRQAVLAYIHQRYGHQRVAQIITFGTLAAKQALKDVARVFRLPTYLSDQLNDILGQIQIKDRLTIAKAVKDSQALVNLMSDQPLVDLIVKTAQKLEGLPRHDSIHAAGIVLANSPLINLVPLQGGFGDDELMVTQYAKETVEAVGLLKMDFLGLRNLTIMDLALRLIHQRQPDFDLTKVPLDDSATLRLFSQGNTDGIFQFESRGIRRVLVNLGLDNFEDLVAVNALYRPGPLNNIDHFIARKHGTESYHLPDPSLQAILGTTYGVLVYQEQVMQVASVMAGFTLGQADLLRRAMSHKNQATMEQMKTRFLAGAEKKGYAKALAIQVYDYIERFAQYGFNRSHAVAYSKMAFEMAYLKVHFPAEFFVALLEIEPNFNKKRDHFADAKQRGVTVVGPRINLSQAGFSLQNGKIIVGFQSIRGLRSDFIAAILKARQAGPFKDIYDFLSRLPEQWATEKYLVPLICVGAFDGLGYNRAELLDSLAGLLSGGKFHLFEPSLQPIMHQLPELPLGERLAKENEYLGVYLSGHPASQYRRLRQQLGGQLIHDVQPDQPTTLVVLFNRSRTVHTKKAHRQMAFVNASDESGQIALTIFPQQYAKFYQLLAKPNQIVAVTGKCVRHNDETEVIVDQLKLANTFKPTNQGDSARWALRLLPEVAESGLKRVETVIKEHPGNYPVVVYDVQTQAARQLLNGAAGDEVTHQAFNAAIGSANVVFQKLPLKK